MLKHIALLLSLSILMWSGLVSSQDFDSEPAWPLCGHISLPDEPPHGWQPGDDCPEAHWDKSHNNYVYTDDLPLSSTFGPRKKKGSSDRHDFHRGLDIHLKDYSDKSEVPVFAVTKGWVNKFETTKHEVEDDQDNIYEFYDTLIRLRHPRLGKDVCDPTKPTPGCCWDNECCEGSGCYYTTYIHMDPDRIILTEDQIKKKAFVEKGELFGYVNPDYRNERGALFPHLHFEIRNSPVYDNLSAWQRDAIHPLRVLPYKPQSKKVRIGKIKVTNPVDAPVARVKFKTKRVDVIGVALVIYDEDGGDYNPVKQPGNRKNPLGYNVSPSWFDMEVWNFQYTHKDSDRIPWESFELGGYNECPHYSEHDPNNPPDEYEANAHLDRAVFNGVEINPGDFSSDNQTYSMTVTFNGLVGPADCVEAYVFLARGKTVKKEWEREDGMCAGLW